MPNLKMSGDIGFEELSPSLQTMIESGTGGSGSGLSLRTEVLSVTATEDYQKEFTIPKEDYNSNTHYFELRLGSVWMHPTRYTIVENKVVFAVDEKGVALDRRLDFVFTYLVDGGVVSGGSSSPITSLDGSMIVNGTVTKQKLSSTFLGEIDSKVAQAQENSVNNSIRHISNPNLLINGDFQVWQRGALFRGSSGYTCDRWRIGSDGEMLLEKTDRGVRITNTAIGTWHNFDQYIEIPKSLYGNKITVTYKFSDATSVANINQLYATQVKSNMSDVIYLYGGLASNVTNNTMSITATITSDRTYAYMCFGVQMKQILNATMNIEYIKVEIGEISTPLSPRSYGEELALCQRYYSVGYVPQIPVAADSTQLCVPIYYPVPMRVVPKFVALTDMYAHQAGSATGAFLLRSAGWSKGMGEQINTMGQLWVYNENTAPSEIAPGAMFVLNASSATNNRLSGAIKYELDAEIN